MKQVLVFILLIEFSGQVRKQKVMMLDRLEICKVSENSPILAGEQVITTINHRSMVNGWFEVLRDVERVSIIFKQTRCSSKFALDTCEIFSTLPVKDSCFFLKLNRTMISSLVYNIKPPLVCPLRKGKYQVTNVTLDPNLELFSMGRWYWKIVVEIYETRTKEFISSVCGEGQVVPIIS